MARKKNPQLNSVSKIIITVAFSLILLLIFFFIKRYAYTFKINTHKTNTNTFSDNSFGSTSYITPTLIPSQNKDTLTFIHPQKHFSFDYPKGWNLIVTRLNVTDPLYDVYLTDYNKNRSFKIDFMTGGRGGPYYEYETNEQKVINGKTINWNVMYKDGKAFEAVVSFPNNDFGHKLIGLYIYLPEENQTEFIQQVEDIIASLK